MPESERIPAPTDNPSKLSSIPFNITCKEDVNQNIVDQGLHQDRKDDLHIASPPCDSTMPVLRPRGNARISQATAFKLLAPFLIGRISAACSGDCAPPEGWDNFVNNLATDLAPLLTLLGEQVTTQYLNESLGRIDSLLFALAPLGIISAMVAAIRVSGRPILWSLIGRAKESRGDVEAELMSSTSSDVCELWGGEGVSRVLGSPVLLQLVHVGSGDVEESHDSKQSRDVKKSKDDKQPTVKNSEGVYLFHEAIRLDLYRKNGDTRSLSDEQVDMEANNDIDDFLTRQNPPNLSLNVSIRPLDPGVRMFFVGIGFFLQIGVLVYGAISQYQLRLLKSNTEVPAYGFPILLTGTISLGIGMFLCAEAVETSTNEETWEPTPKGDLKSIVWLQQGGQTVGDQRFGPFARRSGTQFPDNRVLTSEKAGKGNPFLVTVAIITALFGFVAQFVGLRAMHPSVTIAQLGAVLIMTVLRSCTRIQREGRNDIEDPDEVEGYELDWLAKDLKGCQSWEIDTGREASSACAVQTSPASLEVSTKTPNEIVNSPRTIAERIRTQVNQFRNSFRDVHLSQVHHSASEKADEMREPQSNTESDANAAVMKTRARLARLSPDWKFSGRKKAEVLHGLIEQTMNHVFDNMTMVDDLNTATEFTWTIPVQASFKTIQQEASTTISKEINLVFRRKLIENQGFGAWTIEKSELEAVLSLWTSSIVRADRQRARLKIPRFKKIKILAPATKLTSTHYSAWVPRGRKPELERLYSEGTRYYGYTRGPPSDNVSSVGYLCIDTEGDSNTLCAQELYSLFIFKLAEWVQDVGGETTPHNKDAARAAGTSKDLNNEVFRLHNSNFEQLARVYSEHGMGTTEDAYFSIISAFGSAGKLPYPYETCVETMNNAEELAKGGKWKDCFENDSWLYKNSRSENVPMNIINTITKRLSGQLRRLAKDTTRGKQENLQSTWETVDLYCDLLRSEESQERGLGLITLCLTSMRANPKLNRESIFDLICDTIEFFGGEKMHENQEFRSQVQDLWDGEVFFDFRATARFLWKNTIVTRLQRGKEEGCHLISRVLVNVLRDIDGVLFSHDLQRYLSAPTPLQHAAKTTSDLVVSINEIEDSNLPIDLLLIRNYRSPIQMAAEVGDMTIFKALLEVGAEVDGKPALHHGRTALQAAAGAGHFKIVHLLMEKGAKRDEAPASYSGLTALQAAAGAGHMNIVKFLCGDFEDIKTQAGAAVLGALFSGEVKESQKAEVITDRRFIKRYYSPDDVEYVRAAPSPYSGRTALQAAAEGGHAKIVSYLLSYGRIFDNEPTSDPRISSLQAAATGGHEAIITMLIRAGANMEYGPEPLPGKTALEAAAFSGHKGTIKSLLKCKFDRHKALMRALNFGYDDVIRHLFSNKDFKPNLEGEDGKTLLSKAAECGRPAMIRLFSENGLNIEAVNNNGRTPLLVAIILGKFTQVETLLKGGADIQKVDNNGDTALTLAVYFADLKIVEFLLKNGANIHKADNSGNSPLHNAALKGKEDSVQVIETLLRRGADLEAINHKGRTPLLVAIVVGKLKPLEALLKEGADIEKADHNGDTALTLAAYFADASIVEFLLKNGVDVDKPDSKGNTALHSTGLSGEGGRVEIIEILLQHGADIERLNDNGRTPLLVAAQKGRLDQVDVLLKAGADIGAVDNSGDTVLTLTALFGSESMVEYLLDKGVAIDKADSKANSALHNAAISDEKDRGGIIERLIKRGASIEAVNSNGRTPLLVAAQKGRLEQAGALLKSGADPEKVDSLGDTALTLAAYFSHTDMVTFLLDNGADIHKVDNKGNSALQNAIISKGAGSTKIVEILLQRGADISKKNNEGRTALELAEKEGNEAAKQLLLQAVKEREN